ncbi:MFS transporter [Streptomyces alkaliterrae]|uniref:MFS transporter n=1 Tax=Streptomyces alkaliterrae TaxID=2213162 RepID=A0A7W3WYR2_9ACTN|nr:MFS transporter [Streptomyces alkaliterrae]MBB1260685.1 MFS transporter [Streptomyces alkaliterrae]
MTAQGVSRPGTFAPLAHRAFRRLWIGQCARLVGDGVFTVALMLLILGRPGAASQLGLVLGAETLGAAGVLLFGGALADRVRRTRLMMTADGLRSCAVLVVLALGAAAPVPVLMGCALLVGVASGLFRPAFGAVLPSLVPEDHIQAANALRSLTTRLTGIAGPALGGVLVTGPGSTTAFGVQLGMCAISLLTLYGVRDATPERPAAEGATQERPSLFGDIREGLRVLLAHRWITAVVGQGAVQLALVTAPATLLLPIVLEDRGQVGHVGWVMSASALGAVVGSVLGARLRVARPGLWAMTALLFQLVELACFIAEVPTVTVGAAVLLSGVGYSVFGVLWMSALHTQVPRRYLGRVLSVDATANTALQPVALALMGALIAGVGVPAVAAGAAVVLVTSTLLPLAVPGVAAFHDPSGTRTSEPEQGV